MYIILLVMLVNERVISGNFWLVCFLTVALPPKNTLLLGLVCVASWKVLLHFLGNQVASLQLFHMNFSFLSSSIITSSKGTNELLQVIILSLGIQKTTFQ